MFEYTLTLNEEQCHEVLKSVELLMRLKIGQYQELIYSLCDIYNPELSEQISAADSVFRTAFDIMNKGKKPSEYKDKEWHVLYDLYQVLRKGIHDAEHPEGSGLDAAEPLQFGNMPLAGMKWIKKGDSE